MDGALSYIDTGLSVGRTYYYKVRAYCIACSIITTGNFSSYKYAKPKWPTVSINIQVKSYHSMMISWNMIADVDGYEVYRNTSSRGTYVKIADTAGTSCLDPGLEYGKTYYYKVCPYDLVNDTKVYGIFSRCRYGKPKWPSISVKVGTYEYDSLSLSWTAIAGADGYEMWHSTSSRGTYVFSRRRFDQFCCG